MRWTIVSIAFALALIAFGIYITGPENLNVTQKAIYWFCVAGFLTAQAVHFFVWVRRKDL